MGIATIRERLVTSSTQGSVRSTNPRSGPVPVTIARITTTAEATV
jgi:hypothetical protein